MSLLEIDPSLVVPGWVPLGLTILLGVVVFFLFRSMRKQLRRIEIPDDGVDTRAGAPRESPQP